MADAISSLDKSPAVLQLTTSEAVKKIATQKAPQSLAMPTERQTRFSIRSEKLDRPQSPPSFLDIAKMPSTTALSLKVFLRSNHMEMPNLIISNSDTDDVIAYILSLKEPPALRQ